LEHSSRYIVLFAAAVCGVCSIFVAVSAVALKDRQERNKKIDVQSKVLVLAGLLDEDADVSPDQVERLFSERIVPRVVDLETGAYLDDIDGSGLDPKALAADPKTSHEAPPNPAKVRRIPEYTVVYQVMSDDGQLREVILPVQGKGLWSTLYGFIAIGADGNTIEGITFYEHGETPGLGGEVDNPRWKALWKGRKAFDPNGRVAIHVKKGRAGPPQSDPYAVDGLSGATMTSRGVSNLLAFWLGEQGFGRYLEHFRTEMSGGRA